MTAEELRGAINGILLFYGIPKEKRQEATYAILSLLKQVMEETRPQRSVSTCVCDRDGCWNDCLDQLTENQRRVIGP